MTSPAAELAHWLGARRSGRQWVCKCVAHEDANPSLIIFDGRSAVQFRCLAGCTQRDIIAELKVRGLWQGRVASAGRPVMQTRVSHETEFEQQLRNAQLAMNIFDDGVSIENTPAARYLEQRGLDPRGPGICDVRYVERCPRGKQRVPALVVLMRQLSTTKPLAIQRIYINPLTDKKDGEPMMLGRAGGAAMKLTPHEQTFTGELSTCELLVICEGYETGLALRQRHTRKPVWALGSAGAIATMPVLFGVDSLVIAGDHDVLKRRPDGRWVRAGEEAGYQCVVRWRSQGRAAVYKEPELEGRDYADV